MDAACPDSAPPPATASGLPFLAAGLLLLAGALLGLFARPGLPPSADAARHAFVETHPVLWSVALLAVLPGMIAWIGVVSGWSARLGRPRPARIAEGLTRLAFAIDAVAILMLASLSLRTGLPLADFIAAQEAGLLVAAGVATPLYGIAGLLLSQAAPRRRRAAWLERTTFFACIGLGLGILLALPLVQLLAALIAFLGLPALCMVLGFRSAEPHDDMLSMESDPSWKPAVPNEYRIVTRWRLAASPRELCDVFCDTPALSRWWRAAFLDARELRPAHAPFGVGRNVWIHTKGWLPYSLQLEVEVLECDPSRGFLIRTRGDFVGQCECRLEASGGVVTATFDWRLRAEKGVIRAFSWLLRPLFAWNHRWVMARGREAIEIELRRRREGIGYGDPALPPTPAPTFPYDPLTSALLGRFLPGPLRRSA